MKKYLVPTLVSCIVILTSLSVLAFPVEVAIQPTEQPGQLYSVMKFKLIIANNQNFDDIFQIVVSGEHMEWEMPGLIAKNVPAQSSEETDIVFYPTGTSKGSFEFAVAVESLRNPAVKDSAKLIIEIPYDFKVKSLSSSYSGNAVNFNAVIQTDEQKTLQGAFSIKDSSGRTAGRDIGSAPRLSRRQRIRLCSQLLTGDFLRRLYWRCTEGVGR